MGNHLSCFRAQWNRHVLKSPASAVCILYCVWQPLYVPPSLLLLYEMVYSFFYPVNTQEKSVQGLKTDHCNFGLSKSVAF